MPPRLTPLPIDEAVPRLVARLASDKNLIIVAPPGTGKTTRLPPALAEASWLSREHPHVVVLQPRRVAARAAADRIARERGWNVGKEVGYHIRYDARFTDATRVRFLTEGILTRRLQSDPFLEGVGCVVLDEFHERHWHVDLALALLREIQESVRPDLRLVVMSATLAAEPLAKFLCAPIERVAAPMFPVDLVYEPFAPTVPPWDRAASVVREESARGKGHILVFLPGMAEIRRCSEAIGDIDAVIHWLHGSVSADDQDAALKPTSHRKIVLATNIAETSITIDGVSLVVDAGLARVPRNDPRLGLDTLETKRISLASADQRAGRAGRTGPGRCRRLWTAAEHRDLEPFEIPELARIDLAECLLALRRYGVRDLGGFRWFEAPPGEAVARADALLHALGAIDAKGGLTHAGRAMSGLPVHPRIARMMLAGVAWKVPREAAALAAMLSERESFWPPNLRRETASRHGDSDLLEGLDRLQAERDPAMRWPVIDRARRDLERVAERMEPVDSPLDADHHIRLMHLPLMGWPDRVAVRRGALSDQAVMVGQRGVVLEPSSVVRQAPLFLVLDPREDDAGQHRAGGPPRRSHQPRPDEARVSLASAVEWSWLTRWFPQSISTRRVHEFDAAKERVVTRAQTLYVDVVVREQLVGGGDDAEEVAAVWEEVLLKEPDRLLRRDESLREWLIRARFLKFRLPELPWPELDDAWLVHAVHDLFARSIDEIVAGKPRSAAQRALPSLCRAAMDRDAPETMPVPSGSNVRLEYGAPDAPPVLAVRLQEVFGWNETPRVAGGRVPVLMHLLGPNFRPVQVTSDLANFWKSTYADVRRELRARYPKHQWPEDPAEGVPQAKGRHRHR